MYFLNAEDAEVLAEARKGQSSSAPFAKNSATSAVKMRFGNHTFLVLTRALRRRDQVSDATRRSRAKFITTLRVEITYVGRTRDQFRGAK